MKKPSDAVIAGLWAACSVAQANFEAASDGSGDVSKKDARRIDLAMEWLRSVSQKETKQGPSK